MSGTALATQFFRAVSNVSDKFPNFSERQKKDLKSKFLQLEDARKELHDYAVSYTNGVHFPDTLLGLSDEVRKRENEYQQLFILFEKEIKG